MLMKGLLAASLFAVACAAPMTAQSNHQRPNLADAAAATPVPRQDNVNHIPALAMNADRGMSQAPGAAEIEKAIALGNLQRAVADKLAKGEIASNGEVCFTLREKRFRTESSNQNTPTPYESATCTPASELHRKSATVVLVK